MAGAAAGTEVLALDRFSFGIVVVGRHGARLKLVGGLVTLFVDSRRHLDDLNIPATRHYGPKIAEPSLVIRLTTCDGGRDGGMIGAGGGVGAGYANRSDETVTANANEAAETPVLRMSSSVCGRLVSNRVTVLLASFGKCYISFANKRKWPRQRCVSA